MGSDASRTVERTGRESAEYTGPEGEATFFAFGAMRAGDFIYRRGQMVEALDAESVEWAGDRAGEPLSEADRARILDGIRHWYRSHDLPYQLRLPSGATEDETGAVHTGFRSALPRAEHSDGWSVTDLYQSPEYPDLTDFPPTVVYSSLEGTAEIDRTIEAVDEVRHEQFRDVAEKVHYAVLASDSLRWSDARTSEPMTEADRERIISRIRSVYDEWGYRYVVRESPTP